jgi:hypothetical protein
VEIWKFYRALRFERSDHGLGQVAHFGLLRFTRAGPINWWRVIHAISDSYLNEKGSTYRQSDLRDASEAASSGVSC